MHKKEMSDIYQNGWMSCEKWFEDKELDDHIVDTNEMVELPQKEISDKEIEKGAWEYVKKHKINGGNVVHWKNAIRWYREQLKLNK
jgi:hypothetical protein